MMTAQLGNSIINNQSIKFFHWLSYFKKRVLIYTNIEEDNIDEVIFEFYIINYQHVIESQSSSKNKDETAFEQTLTMDLDQLWLLGLRVLQIFEDTVNSSYPSLFICFFN